MFDWTCAVCCQVSLAAWRSCSTMDTSAGLWKKLGTFQTCYIISHYIAVTSWSFGHIPFKHIRKSNRNELSCQWQKCLQRRLTELAMLHCYNVPHWFQRSGQLRPKQTETWSNDKHCAWHLCIFNTPRNRSKLPADLVLPLHSRGAFGPMLWVVRSSPSEQMPSGLKMGGYL